MYGFKILYEISKVPFEIIHKILNPYTAKYAVYEVLKIWGLLINDIDARACTDHDLIINGNDLTGEFAYSSFKHQVSPKCLVDTHTDGFLYIVVEICDLNN